MKKAIATLIVMTTFFATKAQIKMQPVQYRSAPVIEVGYYSTTVLVFPATVFDEDHGFRDIITEKQNGTTNVLKLKAYRKDFQPTNLNAYTSDGKMYSFKVIYKDEPLMTVVPVDSFVAQPTNKQQPTLKLTLDDDEKLNERSLKESVEKVKNLKPFLSAKTKEQRMKIQLRGIYTEGDLMFIHILITNKSSLAYTMDFARMYVQDIEKIKRKSIQQREIIPVYQDNAVTLAGKSKYSYVFVIPSFTLDNNKQFLVEFFERNGGRNLSLEIKNKHLLQAVKLL